MHHNNHCSFAAQKVDEELKESVDGEGLQNSLSTNNITKCLEVEDTSYTSRIGASHSDAFSDTILAQEEAAYIGTLLR